jgi:dihydrofolate reductase
MKVILYLATTINGLIAKENDDTSFVTSEEWTSFELISRECGNVVMGKRTFEVTLADGTFPYEDRLNVVMTHQKVETNWGKDVVFVSDGPQEVIKVLTDKGYDRAFVAGGGQINSAFMKEGLIDEIYIDVESTVFGRGIPLFVPEDFEYKLKLLQVNKLSEDTVQLQYKVLK